LFLFFCLFFLGLEVFWWVGWGLVKKKFLFKGEKIKAKSLGIF
jgi:hypothetical protein